MASELPSPESPETEPDDEVDRVPILEVPEEPKFRFRPGTRTALLSTISAFAGIAAAVLTTLVIIAPNLAPSTTNLATLSNAYSEPRVPLGAYLHDPPIVLSLQHNPQTRLKVNEVMSQHSDSLANLGTVVDFSYQVVGYRHHSLSIRWTAFDAQTRQRIRTSEEYDLLPLRFTAEKRDGDIGTWEIWVNNAIGPGQTIFLMIELYDPGAGTRLSYLISDPFALP